MFYSGAADAGWEMCLELLGLDLEDLQRLPLSTFCCLGGPKRTMSCSFGSLLVCPPAGSPGGPHLCGSLRGTRGKHAGRPGDDMWLQKVMTDACFPAFLNVDVMWPFGQKRATHLQGRRTSRSPHRCCCCSVLLQRVSREVPFPTRCSVTPGACWELKNLTFDSWVL